MRLHVIRKEWLQVDEMLGAHAAMETIVAAAAKYEEEFVAKAHRKFRKAVSMQDVTAAADVEVTK